MGNKIEGVHKQKSNFVEKLLLVLDYPDSNQEKQDQNLLCYHYTIVQSKCQIPSVGTRLSFRCWATRTRTRKNRTRICCVTITP